MKIELNTNEEFLDVLSNYCNLTRDNFLKEYFLGEIELFDEICKYFDNYEEELGSEAPVINISNYISMFEHELILYTLEEIKQDYEINSIEELEEHTIVYFAKEVKGREIIAFSPEF